MSAGKVYFTKEEQLFLIYILEMEDPMAAAEKFISIMVEEKAKPEDSQMFLRKIMKRSKVNK